MRGAAFLLGVILTTTTLLVGCGHNQAVMTSVGKTPSSQIQNPSSQMQNLSPEGLSTLSPLTPRQQEGYLLASTILVELLKDAPQQGQLTDGRSCEVTLSRTMSPGEKTVGVRVQMSIASKVQGRFHMINFDLDEDSTGRITVVESNGRITVHHSFKAFDSQVGSYDASDFISFIIDDGRLVKGIAIYEAAKMESLQAVATCYFY